MKTLFKYLTVVVSASVLLTACWEEVPGEFEQDKSIAGTVSEGRTMYNGTIDCKHDRETICDGTRRYIIDLTKVSDQEVDLWFALNYTDTLVRVSIPKIPLSGIPWDASFDHSTSQGVVSINDIEYSSVTLLVRGWIRDTEMLNSRFSPYIPSYDSQISISGKVANKDFVLNMNGKTTF